MKLKHFLALLFTALLGATVWSSYHAYHTNRSLILDYIADWSSSALLQTEPSLIQALKTSQYPTIQKLLDRGAASRPFIAAYSLSRNGKSYLLSSDRTKIGNPVEGGYTTVTGTLYESISRGKSRFQLPMQYYHEGNLRTAYLLMELDRQYIFDQLVTRSLQTALQSVTAVVIVFGLFLFLLYRFLIVPVQHISSFVKTRHDGVHDYFISEFDLLSETIRESFMTLFRQKEQIQEALQYEQYLEAILQTVADINKLLVVSKSTQELLQKSCDRLALHGDYRLAWIGFAREKSIEIVVHSEDSTGYLEGGLGISLDPEDPTSEGPTAQSVLANRTIIIDDLFKDPKFTPWQERAGLSRFQSIIALPLRSDSYSAPFGTLAIYTANPKGFDAREVAMLEELAGDIGFAVDTFEKRDQLQYHLTTDPLTGLANRAMLLEALSRQEIPEVMLVDIDQFREINEVYGFEIGDQLIRTFASTLERFVETYPQLSLYCLGIDHFALLFSSGHGIDIHDFAGTLIRHMERQQYDCLGIAIMPQVTTGFARAEAQTVERAELALKHAKAGKRKLTVFDPSLLMVEKYQETIQWYNVVRKAIDEDRIVPFFQGIVDNRSGRITKYETLIRLILDNGNVVTPEHFLEIAKKTRLYPDLTKIVVSKALRAFRDETAELSINISLEDILNKSVVATLHEEITANAMAERVTFELLESEGIKDYERVATFIKSFKALGCKIAIDDFGSGYSNFEHLLNLQIDYLKIDGSLIQNLVHDRNAQVLVKHIQSFASDLNMKTVAEFVSSEAIAEAVKGIGIDYSQGYHFHKPSLHEKLPKT
jgi:diguanylate cyclase (GGDEF)-like protein